LVLCGNPECDLLPMVSQNPGDGRGYYYWHCDRRRGGCGNRTRGPRLETLTAQVALDLLLRSPAPAFDAPAFDDGPMRAIERQLAEVRSALASREILVVDAAPVIQDLRRQLADQVEARDEYLTAQRVIDDWHSTQAWAIGARDPEAIRAVVDNVRVLPDRAGVVVEGMNRAVVDVPGKVYDVIEQEPGVLYKSGTLTMPKDMPGGLRYVEIDLDDEAVEH
jgi:hypothetical protein